MTDPVLRVHADHGAIAVFMSARLCALTSSRIMCAPTSMQALARRRYLSSSPMSGLSPRFWLRKSITVVVPPNAAALVPVAKVSTVREVPNSQSRCVCTSAREHQESRGIMHGNIGADGRVHADGMDAAVIHQDVRRVVVHRRDDPTVPDERRCHLIHSCPRERHPQTSLRR